MNVAIIDIGSGSVGLAGVLLEKDKVPILKFSKRIELTLQEKLDPERLLQESFTAIERVIADMQKGMALAPSSVFCFLSPHLIVSQARNIILNFDKSSTVNSLVINDAVNRELKRFSAGNNSGEVVIEHKIMGVKLNGYETTNLKDRIANRLEISIFFTLAPADILNKIKKQISSSFHNEQVEFHSFSIAHFAILRDIFRAEQNFAFIDIGSEITDVSLVREGVIEKTTSFPLGKNTFIRSIMNKMQVSAPVALSIIKKGGDLVSVSEEWITAIRGAIDSNNFEGKVREKIFILTDKDFSGATSAILNQQLEIKELTSTDLNKFCQNYSGAVDDPFLMVASIFVNKLLN
ncbi:MAG: hypothetical protein Q7S19_03175 [bacterium]|nr:hypothetical protein [bacterium]